MAKKDFYIYVEALAVVREMGVESRSVYNARYREDSRLPAIPDRQYANVGWTNWYDFLGTKKPNLYTRYVEAQAAAQKLEIKKHEDYLARYREDPRLPAAPNLVYEKAGWIDWYEFLGKDKPNPYSAYVDAKESCQKLGIRSREDYLARYREDPRLPAAPNTIYMNAGWSDWYDFCGNEKLDRYAVYIDARVAAQKLGVTSTTEYSARYREDPKLPGRPENYYADLGWTDWFDFLGKEKSPWYTFAEAQAVCLEMGVKNSTEYYTRYQEDPKLPSTPSMTYASIGWTDWYEFLGNERSPYYSYAEAQLVCRTMGIKNSIEYSVRYQEDPRLHSAPDRAYMDCGWTNWYEYIGSGRPLDRTSDYPNIAADVERWLKNETGITTKRASIRTLLNGYVRPLGIPDDSKYLLLRTNQFNVFVYQQMIEGQVESVKKKLHYSITTFFDWLLDADCTDEDNGERIVLKEFRNPFRTALAGYADSLSSYRASQSTKPPLGYEYILRARNFLVPNGEAAMLVRPTLRDLPHLHDFFSTRNDWISVDESLIDQTDPNCIFRKSPKDGSIQVWSPVRFVALYTLLRFPLRGQQILWLDSGEADEEIAVLEPGSSVSWKKNTNPLFKNRNKNRRPQAAVQRGVSNAPKLYVTTNKTGKKVGGYDVDWIPDDLVYWFVLLRDWQAKYNPISAPTPWTSIKLKAETNAKILAARKEQCFLFRMGGTGQPFMPTAVFAQTLPALLHKVQRVGEDLAKIDQKRFVSPYTPHSLRVSLITAFIVDGNAPIHLISKLVGHASLVMTIYYTKLNSEQMRRPMGEVEKLAAQRAASRSADAIRVGGLNALAGQLIITDRNKSLIESDTPSSACVVFDWGICPMSAAACNVGGEVSIERQSENIYGPVEAGYLGQKNCTRCRFFVTGVPFLGGLVSLANEIALEIATESIRYQDFTEKLEGLEQEHYDACQANTPFTRENERKSAVANQQQSAGKLDVLLSDYASLHDSVASCLKLVNQNEPDSGSEVRLIISGDIHEMGVTYQESETSYHLLAEICQNATIYQSANPSRAVPLIADAIDRMAENNNLAPAMFRLSSEQKMIVANELNRLLLHRLGSWEKIDDLFSGDLMLLDVDANEPELTRVSTEIRQLLAKPNYPRHISHEVSVYG